MATEIAAEYNALLKGRIRQKRSRYLVIPETASVPFLSARSFMM